MTFKGHVQDGVVVFDTTCELEDGTIVRIEPITAEDSRTILTDNLDLFRADEKAKCTGTPDLAINHDHYLYGHPKVSH